MIAFATFNDLRRALTEADERAIFAKAASRINKNTFLSHSSADDNLLPGVIRVLENHGGNVYCDKKDPTLPQGDFTQTADHLRTVMRGCKKFVLLVTPRTKDSKWVPWELGLGDGVNHSANVALFPSAEASTEQEWSKQEYLGLYKRIVWGDFEGKSEKIWMVIEPRPFQGARYSALPLEDWIRA